MIRSGLRSLLQSISIFRMREMDDARSLAGLAMEVYSDHIGVDLAFEPEPDMLIDTMDAFAELIARVDSPRLGLKPPNLVLQHAEITRIRVG